MALLDGQWRIRDLVIGPGTAYRLMDTSNPFDLTVRADQGGPRAWNHGSWSGAEWANERIVPIRILVRDEAVLTVAGWREARHLLAAAFAPVGDVAEAVELRFIVGGTEYVLFGRPRMVEFDTQHLGLGYTFTQAAFVAQDPRIYAGVETVAGPLVLPTLAGGLTVPLTLPLTVDSTLVGGEVDLLNEGTTATGLHVRIDGPVPQPRVILQRPDGILQSVVFVPSFTLPAGQWIELDTAARTAFLNGLPQSSVRGQAAWDMDPYPLLPGVTTLRFGGGDVADGTLTARLRSAWW